MREGNLLPASLCRRFTLGDRAWEIDLMTLSFNDAIALQELSGRTWMQIIAGLDAGDAVVIKVVWFAARRATGEDIALDSEDMNPKWATFSIQEIPHLTVQPEPTPSAPAAQPAAKKAPRRK
jgi:hypothetical protein